MRRSCSSGQTMKNDMDERERVDALLVDALRQAPLVLVTTDRGLRCVAVVGAVAPTLGLDPAAVVGSRLVDLVDLDEHADDEDGLATRLDRALAGEQVAIELRLAGRVLQGTAGPCRDSDGRVVGVTAGLVDITARVNTEQSLHDALARERGLVARLRELDELKNAFLQAVSHELRTPLTALRGFATTLASSVEELTPERRRVVAERLVANAAKLERMLTDLLDVDRLSRGIVEPQRRPTDVAGLVARVVAETDLAGRSVGVQLDPVTVDVDGPKVERIVENLLANAIKHTPDGTRLHVAVRAQDQGVRLRVEQEDVAIPDELKQAIFEPFRQGPALNPHAPGTGIGLALVARFAELHGGGAWVEDRPGGGAVFCVDLPAPHAESADA